MDTLKSDLDLLENLSKKISDLIYNNEYSEIPEIDNQRRSLIKKIKESEIQKRVIKQRVSQLIEKNIAMVKATEKKLHNLKINHSKFNNRFKAYASNRR